MIPEGYELIDGEFVRKADLYPGSVIQNHIEKDIVNFFDMLGFDIKKIPTTIMRTADYDYGELGIEVTSVQAYSPQNHIKLDKLLKRCNETNSRICAYMFLKGNSLEMEILDEQKIDNNVSILCLRQHISCYRPN